jgi:hypothetical protein
MRASMAVLLVAGVVVAAVASVGAAEAPKKPVDAKQAVQVRQWGGSGRHRRSCSDAQV